jgi:hypothetical protein
MPAFTALSVNDGAAAPVAHTFSQVSLDQAVGIARYADRSSGIAIGYPTVTLQITYPSAKGRVSDPSRVVRVKANVELPIMEVLSGNDAGYTPAPTIAYVMRGHTEFILPERSSLQNRKDIFAYVKNLLANAAVTALVQDQEAIY